MRLKQVDHVISEVKILSSIKHPFIVNILGINHDERYIYLFLEYVAGGELFTYLRTIGNLNNEDSKFFAA